MRDGQLTTFLRTWGGALSGEISYDVPLSSSVRLKDILEPNVLGKYFLSPKACEGILRRAANRGKELPETLRRALEQVVSARNESETREDKTALSP